MNKNWSPVRQAMTDFFRTTTLHGFKYLCSKYYFDRVGWVICCVASTCCAGLLCAVLWARFLEVPALLELLDTRANEDVTQFLPDIAICPPVNFSSYFSDQLFQPYVVMSDEIVYVGERDEFLSIPWIHFAGAGSIALYGEELGAVPGTNNPGVGLMGPLDMIYQRSPPLPVLLSLPTQICGTNSSMSARLSRTMSHVIARKPAAHDQLVILEELLDYHNITLAKLLIENTPDCDEVAIKCRWQKSIVPCQYLFEKEHTNTGICCIMKAERAYNRLIHESFRPTAYFEQNRRLDLSLQCSNKSIVGCQFYTKYYSETNVKKVLLVPGYVYIARLMLSSVPMSSTEEFVQSDCISDTTYSKEICLETCAEKSCGCSDPVRDFNTYDENKLPPCNITHLVCLKSYSGSQDNASCKCLPSCNKITSDLSLDSIPLDIKTFTLDPIYGDLNDMSTVLHIKLNVELSRIFTLNPTETWLTLLSSLGGVFNMFLGVGLFSALELLFLVLIKLPIAFIKSPHN